jgi:hypothetical protein
MSKKFLKILNNIVIQLGYQIYRLNAPTKIKKFIKNLEPVRSSYPLIRIGSKNDGGYIIPSDFENLKSCFSPGVDTNSSFENQISEYGINCFLADYSVSSAAVQNESFHFIKKYIGAVSDEKHTTLEQWVSDQADSNDDLILQMDIEGCEYDVIMATPVSILKRFRILVIEFHNLERLIEPEFLRMTSLCFAKLKQDFSIVHMHPNNCMPIFDYKGVKIPPIIEITFHRNDRMKGFEPIEILPHFLDAPNVPERPDTLMPEIWYKRQNI